jgi:hypothetical protein
MTAEKTTKAFGWRISARVFSLCIDAFRDFPNRFGREKAQSIGMHA